MPLGNCYSTSFFIPVLFSKHCLTHGAREKEEGIRFLKQKGKADAVNPEAQLRAEPCVLFVRKQQTQEHGQECHATKAENPKLETLCHVTQMKTRTLLWTNSVARAHADGTAEGEKMNCFLPSGTAQRRNAPCIARQL